MILEKDFEDFIRLLNTHMVKYMVVGGYALALHGKPRHTGDLDIWIKISDDNATRLLKVIKEFGLSSLGLKKSDFLEAGYITQIGYPPIRIDILNSIDGVTFDDAAIEMQILEIEDGLNICYIGLTDFLKNKKASGRKQDLADVKEIKKLQATKNTAKKKKQ